MRDRFFDLTDWAAEHLVKFVLLSLFVGCTLYLTIVAGPLGLLFGGVVYVFARWARADDHSVDDGLEVDD